VAIKDLRDNLKRLKDADPVELASQVNNWLQESGEALKVRIEDEVEKAVTKRGFVKRSEFLKLEARISELEGEPKRAVKKVEAKKSTAKKSAAKTSTKIKTKGRK
jgi:ribosomal protein L31E